MVTSRRKTSFSPILVSKREGNLVTVSGATGPTSWPEIDFQLWFNLSQVFRLRIRFQRTRGCFFSHEPACRGLLHLWESSLQKASANECCCCLGPLANESHFYSGHKLTRTFEQNTAPDAIVLVLLSRCITPKVLTQTKTAIGQKKNLPII